MTPQEATALVHAAVPALARFGLTVTALDDEGVRLRMPLAGNTNHLGTMYAGALFAIAELPGGLLPMGSLAGRAVPVIKEMTIRFLRPARGPVELSASMPRQRWQDLLEQVQSAGRAPFDLELTVTDENGTPVAASRASYLLMPPAATGSAGSTPS